MTFVYIVIAYCAGVGTSLLVIVTQAWANHLAKEIESPPLEPQEEITGAQFVDPEPLSEKLREGMDLKEIIE